MIFNANIQFIVNIQENKFVVFYWMYSLFVNCLNTKLLELVELKERSI